MYATIKSYNIDKRDDSWRGSIKQKASETKTNTLKRWKQQEINVQFSSHFSAFEAQLIEMNSWWRRDGRRLSLLHYN